MIKLIYFEEKYQPDFKRLNLQWLDKFELTESHDLLILDYPQREVIDPGGVIFLAMNGEEVIGTAGLMKVKEGDYELVKMAVAEDWRGQGISKLLLERCIEEARIRHAHTVHLFSNSRLQTALQLYTKYGFRQVPVTDAPYETSDVKMELSLQSNT